MSGQRDIRKASPRGIKILIVIAILVILGLVGWSFFGKSAQPTQAQLAIQNEATTIYNTAEANVKTHTLLANGDLVTNEQFGELPVTVAATALYTAGQLQNYSDMELLTGGGVDPTMDQLKIIMTTEPAKLQVNSLGQLTAIPSGN